MQRRKTGFATPILMLIPMLGVPAMAIFGIPQFEALRSSFAAPADEPELPGFHENRLGHSAIGTTRAMQVPTTQPLDVFQPYDKPAAPDAKPVDNFGNESVRWSDPLRMANNQPAPASAVQRNVSPREASIRASRQIHQQVYDIFADDFRDQSPANQPAPSYAQATTSPRATSMRVEPIGTASPEGLTWRDAIDRLNAYGSTSYRLTPGAKNDYRFVCLVRSPDDDRITRRFEAESTEPLVAVEDVLAQIETWRQRQ